MAWIQAPVLPTDTAHPVRRCGVCATEISAKTLATFPVYHCMRCNEFTCCHQLDCVRKIPLACFNFMWLARTSYDYHVVLEAAARNRQPHSQGKQQETPLQPSPNKEGNPFEPILIATPTPTPTPLLFESRVAIDAHTGTPPSRDVPSEPQMNFLASD